MTQQPTKEDREFWRSQGFDAPEPTTDWRKVFGGVEEKEILEMLSIPKDQIAEARRAINDGNEDAIGLRRVANPPMCEAIVPSRLYRAEGVCPRAAKFITKDGKKLCSTHAEIWACQNN